jgi:hypothetical protein
MMHLGLLLEKGNRQITITKRLEVPCKTKVYHHRETETNHFHLISMTYFLEIMKDTTHISTVSQLREATRFL